MNTFEYTLKIEELNRITTKKGFNDFEKYLISLLDGMYRWGPTYMSCTELSGTTLNLLNLIGHYLNATTKTTAAVKLKQFYNKLAITAINTDKDFVMCKRKINTRGRENLLYTIAQSHDIPPNIYLAIHKAIKDESTETI